MVAAMPATQDDLFARLAALGIETETHRHPPLFTVEDSKALRGALPGGHTKNLFLRDKKGAMWLVIADEDRAVDLKALGRRLGAKTLSFGSAERLRENLGIEPGAVTAFALINDGGGRVTAVIDRALLVHDIVNCHPLTNDATTAIAPRDLLAFMADCGHEPLILDFDAPGDEAGG